MANFVGLTGQASEDAGADHQNEHADLSVLDGILAIIASRQLPCLFVSPHLDDAILSAGEIIARLSGQTRIDVATVFTSCTDDPRLGRRFVRQCGYTDAHELFVNRRAEDIAVLSTIGARIHHLGFTDAAWRKFPDESYWHAAPLRALFLDLLYPIRPVTLDRLSRRIPGGSMLPIPKILRTASIAIPRVSHMSRGFGVIAPQDRKMMCRISEKLRELIVPGETVVFAPAGFGGHVDHIITREVVHSITSRVIYWKDVAYDPAASPDNFLQAVCLTEAHATPNAAVHDLKRTAVLGYQTQLPILERSNELPDLAEVFYHDPDLHRLLARGSAEPLAEPVL